MNDLEKQYRDEIMKGVLNLTYDVNGILNTLNIKKIPNIAMEAYNKITIISYAFYIKKEMFYTSAISNFIIQYLMYLSSNGIGILQEYEYAMKKSFYKSPVAFYKREDFELLTTEKRLFEKYNSCVEKIIEFNIENDILTAVKSCFFDIYKELDNNFKNNLIRMLNIDLKRLGYDIIVPSIDKLTEEDKGKEKRK